MKKVIFTSLVAGSVLLAGCGDDSAEQLQTLEKEHTALTTQYETLSADYETLQQQYDEVIATQQATEESVTEEEAYEAEMAQKEAERKAYAEILQSSFTSVAPQTAQGPYQVLIQGDNEYEVKEMMLEEVPNAEMNAYELAFQQLFSHLTFNEVIIHENDTITIDIHENSTGSPNMTATGQTSPFFDMLEFFLYYNFPELKGYYIYSNGEPASIGEIGVFENLQPNNGVNFENLYFDLHI